MRRVLVISNGIGEDSIGAEIIRQLPRTIVAEAYPTLGDGRAYRGICPIVGPRARLASEGSRVDRGTLRKDIAGGGLKTIPPALKFLRTQKATYDAVLVVGDFIGIAACWLSGIRNVVYLDVYNTGHSRKYYLVERIVMRKVCRTVFCRSPVLAAQLTASGIDARAPGNIMMDTIPSGDYDAARRRLRLKSVLLLPGSRETTIANFALQVEALGLLPEDQRPDIFVAVAEGIDPAELGQSTRLFFHAPQGREDSDLGRLSGRGLHVHLARGALKPLLEASDIVLSQAGTATVQALGLGRPVITFVRDTDRMERFTDENKLFGEARILVPAEAEPMAAEIRRLLDDPAERTRLGDVGKARIGGPGVIEEVIAAIAGAPRPESASASP